MFVIDDSLSSIRWQYNLVAQFFLWALLNLLHNYHFRFYFVQMKYVYQMNVVQRNGLCFNIFMFVITNKYI